MPKMKSEFLIGFLGVFDNNMLYSCISFMIKNVYFYLFFTLTANLAQRFKISKYPTLKLIRNGKLMKREYRGQRSLEAITDYVRELLRDPVKELATSDEIQNVDVSYFFYLFCWITASHLYLFILTIYKKLFIL